MHLFEPIECINIMIVWDLLGSPQGESAGVILFRAVTPLRVRLLGICSGHRILCSPPEMMDDLSGLVVDQ